MAEVLVTEEFLDTYEGEVMFLSQDLEELSQKILNTEFSQEELELLAQNMLDVHDVFLSSTYTQHIAPIFKDFSDFIMDIEIDLLFKNEECIIYLNAIVSDINTYINQYFVDRIFSDVYLFQDSLKNSTEFFESAYKHKQDSSLKESDDGSELLFL